jgi:hypothetical protein
MLPGSSFDQYAIRQILRLKGMTMAHYLTDDELKTKAQAALKGAPKVHSVWKHYKGGVYTVVAVSLKEDTLEPLVTYRSNKRGTYWSRTMKSFLEHLETSPGAVSPRFRQVPD